MPLWFHTTGINFLLINLYNIKKNPNKRKKPPCQEKAAEYAQSSMERQGTAREKVIWTTQSYWHMQNIIHHSLIPKPHLITSSCHAFRMLGQFATEARRCVPMEALQYGRPPLTHHREHSIFHSHPLAGNAAIKTGAQHGSRSPGLRWQQANEENKCKKKITGI